MSPRGRYRYCSTGVNSEISESVSSQRGVTRVGPSSKFRCSWVYVYDHKRNRDFLTAIHAIKCAFAVVRLRAMSQNSSKQIMSSSTSSSASRLSKLKSNVTAFLLGVPISFEKRAFSHRLEMIWYWNGSLTQFY